MIKYILCLATILMVSCKKDYTCSCLEHGSGSPEPIEYYVQVFHSSKSDAQKSCDQVAKMHSGGDEQACGLK